MVVGQVAIGADFFQSLGDGRTVARGNVAIGDYFVLLNNTDTVTYDDNTITIDGTVLLRSTTTASVAKLAKPVPASVPFPIVSGHLTVDPATGLIAVDSSAQSLVTTLASLSTNGLASLTALDVLQGTAIGTASLQLQSQDVHVTATLQQFTIAPGPQYSGVFDAFQVAFAGMTIDAAAGATLSNAGLDIPQVTVTLPSQLGGATSTLNNFHFGPTGIRLNADRAFALPNLQIGDGSKVKFTANTATLSVDNTNQRYALTLATTLQINLPDNAQSIATTVSLATVNGTTTLTGQLDQLAITLAQSTLTMSDVTLSSAGLAVASATLTLPASLGSTTTTIGGVAITGAGLLFSDAKLALPNIVLAGSAGADPKLTIADPEVTLMVTNGTYQFSGAGTLELRLPSNSQDIALTFVIDNSGQFAATLSNLTLTVAESTLALQNLSFDNSGMRAGSAALTLPPSLGTATGTLDTVRITESGLQIGGGSFSLPTIKIGDGSKLSLSAITAQLAIQSNDYQISANATLNINLPGNQQSPTIGFMIDNTGNLQATLDQLTLLVAQSTLTIANLQLDNRGLSAAEATIALPPNLAKGASPSVVRDVHITANGLSLGSGTIGLPDIYVANSATSQIRFYQLQATISTKVVATYAVPRAPTRFGLMTYAPNGLAQSDAFVMTLAGKLALRLPQNSSNDIGIAATIDEDGNFSASLSELSLSLAQANLKLQGVNFDSTGASATSASISLPAALGGTEGNVSGVRISSNGLTVNGGGISFNVPNFKIGGGSGFAVTGKIDGTQPQATIQLEGGSSFANSTYKLILEGKVTVNIPGSSDSATGSIFVTSQGNIGGQLEGLTLSLAGMALGASGVNIETSGGDTQLVMASASLELPGGQGSAAVYNVRISPTQGLSIGGGKFALPTINTGGVSLELGGELRKEGNGYIIAANGYFSTSSLSAGGGCRGIAVAAEIYANFANQMMVQFESMDGQGPSATIPMVGSSPQLSQGTDSFGLRSASLRLACQIPIGTTGMYLTYVEGSVTLGAHPIIQVSAGLAAGKSIAGVSALSADATMTLQPSPFELALNGTVKVFIFQVGGASARLTSTRFNAVLWVEMIVSRGSVTVDAWSDYRGFHFSGAGQMEVGIPKGQIWEGCVSGVSCSTEYRRKCKWGACVKIPYTSCRTTQWCINVPSANLILSNVRIEAGEFTNGKWGFKGETCLSGYCTGVYIDTGGAIAFGSSIRNYTRLTPSQLVRLRQLWAARDRGEISAAAAGELQGVTLAPNSVILDAQIAARSDVIFVLSVEGNAPPVHLLSPSGTVFDQNNLPANITYNETVTLTVGSPVPSTLATVLASSQQAEIEEEAFQRDQLIAAVGSDGVAALQAIGVQSLLPAQALAETAEIRVVHSADSLAAVDILLDGQVTFAALQSMESSATNSVSHYGTVAAGPHTISVVPTGATSPILLEQNIDLAQGQTYSFALTDGNGAVTGQLFTDENRLAALGQARVRLVHLGSQLPAIAVSEGATPIFNAVAFGQASPYVTVAAGTHNWTLQSTTGETAPLDEMQFAEGMSYTLFLYNNMSEGVAYPGLLSNIDLYASRLTQIMYTAHEIDPGTWQIQVDSDLDAKNFHLEVFGNIPPPAVTGLNATVINSEELQVSWQISAESPETLVSVFANPWESTRTERVVNAAGVTEENTVDNFTGTPLVIGLAPTRDGSTQSVTFDTSKLRSGSYKIWVEVDDQNRAPVRLYVPTAVTIDHPWPTSWNAQLSILESYRAMTISWQPPSPDADRYVLSIGTDPLVPDQVITKTETLTATVSALEPGRLHYLTLEAYESESGRMVRAQQQTYTPMAPAFTLTADPGALTIRAGAETAGSLRLSSSIVDYPEAIRVRGKNLPAGLSLAFDNTLVTPTPDGTKVSFTLDSSVAIAAGVYQVLIEASGGGVTHEIAVSVTVEKPHFTLTPDLATVTLDAGGAATLRLAIGSVFGAQEAVALTIFNAPAGLDWHFAEQTVQPGAQATLTLQDTALLVGGHYLLRIVGSQPNYEAELVVPLTINKPAFLLETTNQSTALVAGTGQQVVINVREFLQWQSPVTLTFSSDTAPAEMVTGLAIGTFATTAEALQARQSQVTVSVPEEVTLVMQTATTIEPGTHFVTVNAISANIQKALTFTVEIITPTALEEADEPRQWQSYLPFILR